MGGKEGRVFRNNCKGHMDKTKVVWKQGREVGMAGVGGEWWGVNADNCTRTTIKQLKKKGFLKTIPYIDKVRQNKIT